MPILLKRVGGALLIALASGACLGSDQVTAGDQLTTTKLTLVESAPSDDMRDVIRGYFEQSDVLALKYRPAELMGRALFGSSEVAAKWKYLVQYRCAYVCDGPASALRAYLNEGLRVQEHCPPPIDLAIEFNRDLTQIGTVLFNTYASCFSIGATSYVVVSDQQFLRDLLDQPVESFFR